MLANGRFHSQVRPDHRHPNECPLRSCAIPVSWRIQRGSWMDPAVELLREPAPAVIYDMTVIVLCHRR